MSLYIDAKSRIDIANDPNIDLVVSSIRVDRHAGSLIPSIKAGKNVFVEWPLEANYTLAKELTDLVKTHKVRNVVGLQGSFSPVITKAKALIASGEIGKVESSSLIALAKNITGATVLSPVDYFIDRKIGGNISTIAFGHSVELLTSGKREHRFLIYFTIPVLMFSSNFTQFLVTSLHTAPSSSTNIPQLTSSTLSPEK